MTNKPSDTANPDTPNPGSARKPAHVAAFEPLSSASAPAVSTPPARGRSGALPSQPEVSTPGRSAPAVKSDVVYYRPPGQSGAVTRPPGSSGPLPNASRPPAPAVSNPGAAHIEVSGAVGRPMLDFDPAVQKPGAAKAGASRANPTKTGVPARATTATLRGPAAAPPKSRAGLAVGAVALLAAAGLVFLLARPAPREKTAAVPGVIALWGGAHTNAQLLAYVQGVADGVTPHLKGLEHMTVEVANSTTPQLLALPGDHVIVTVGVLRRLSTAAHLAAVLAHAGAHLLHDVNPRTATTAAHDAAAQASALATTPRDARSEAELDSVTLSALVAAGYGSAGFADAYELLGVNNGLPSPFYLTHLHAPDVLRAQRLVHPSGHTGESEYARAVLDRLGGAQPATGPTPAAPPASTAPAPTPVVLPPTPAATPPPAAVDAGVDPSVAVADGGAARPAAASVAVTPASALDAGPPAVDAGDAQ